MDTYQEKATFAGGCFWCLESAFAETEWILETRVWYAGWVEPNPSYEDVYSWRTWHREAIQITYDPKIINYETIVDTFWTLIDPTDSGGQFSDRGFSYTSAIFYRTSRQRYVAESSKKRLASSGLFPAPIVTPVIPFTTFYEAEEYHQKYYKKSSFRYSLYFQGSGRQKYQEDTWTPEARLYLQWKDAILAKKYSKPSDEELRGNLGAITYEVTQEDGTEPPFSSEFAEKWKDGIYVDAITGAPLFSSVDQYDAWCGWPSFSHPIHEHFIMLKQDTKYGMNRTEVRSKYGDNHLGHVFPDGPEEKWGERYCINGASLRFIPKERLKEEWYAEYEFLFKKPKEAETMKED